MDADDIAGKVKFLELHDWIAGLGVHRPGDDAHAEAGGDTGELAADGAESDDSTRLAVELGRLAARPASGASGGVDLRDAASDCEQQGERMFRDRDCGYAWCVGDRDAVARGGRQVDVVRAGSP